MNLEVKKKLKKNGIVVWKRLPWEMSDETLLTWGRREWREKGFVWFGRREERENGYIYATKI